MKTSLLPTILIALLLASCTSRFYAPALYNHDVSYQPKPSSFDSGRSATYLSAGTGFNQAVNVNNTVSFGELNISEGHVFKNTNLSYGAYGFVGSIDNSNHDNELKDPYSFASKSFAGVGGRASFNFYKQMDNTNFRFIGIEANYSKEYGDFAAYRKLVNNLPDYNSITRTELFTLGATSEILWHSRNNKNIHHAIRAFAGKTFGDFKQVTVTSNTGSPAEWPIYLAASYFMNVNHFWGDAELTKNDYSVPGLRIKFGYKF